MAWPSPGDPRALPTEIPDLQLFTPLHGMLLFLGVLVLLVLLMGLWSRMLARRVASTGLNRSIRRFNKSMSTARMMIPVWFAVGLLVLGWKRWVFDAMGPAAHWSATELPSTLIGTLPVLLAWMGLWWSQYPADRALREQTLLIQLDDNLPIHSPPGFWSYFGANLRLQLLFTIVPVLAIMFLRDIASVISFSVTGHALYGWMEFTVAISSAGAIFIFAPSILKRVLHTRPLPDSPLRRRLEELCQRHNLKYRDILLWHTQNSMGNAAVMGVLPQVRYVLLSDLLLETMTDQQIEAVFAHELGHIVYRHMLWYVVFITILMLAAMGPGQYLFDLLFPNSTLHPHSATFMAFVQFIVSALGATTFFVLFGYLSRRCERQADVFAARMMELEKPPELLEPEDTAGLVATATATAPADVKRADTWVGPYGANLFSSALHRVAVINNIPVAARSWCHGSIAKRMDYLKSISSNPEHTTRFDRVMARLYVCLFACLLATIGWVVIAEVLLSHTQG
jgi:STE24 endopeptidase